MNSHTFKRALPFALLLFCTLATPVPAQLEQQGLPTRTQQDAAETRITEASMRADIRFLADDLLEGRGPGTRGDLLAQKYIAAQFEMLGLEKVVENEDGPTWFQEFPLIGVTTRPPRMIEFKHADQRLLLNNSDDYIVTNGTAEDEVAWGNVELVFVGYGMQAPEYDWDDYGDINLEDKVVVIMNNDPADDPELFAGTTRLYYGRWDYKYAKAAELGAVGALIIHTDESAGYPYQVVQTSWTGEQMALGGAQTGRLQLEGWLTEESARNVFEMSGHDLDELRESAGSRDFEPVPLGSTMSFYLKSMVAERSTANVLGLLPGSDPELSKEWIVYTAHHDHIGMAEVRDDGVDNIYNGAVDNASGCGALLAIAKAYAALPESERPKRSILFAFVGAEEQGLLGSEYLARNPPVEPGNLAAVINIDGINILGPTEDVVVVGKGKSDMDQIVERIARWQKRIVVADQFPERGFYYRSDQFSLAKIGVPGVYLNSGTSVIGRPDGWGRDQLRLWTETTYHQVSDEYSDDWNMAGALQDARLLFYVGLEAANQPELPAWLPGDEFEAARLKALEAIGR